MSYRQRSTDAEFEPKGPHCFVQWKGTDVCADVYCECGHHGHIDGDFFYFYECAKCHRIYEVGCYVGLIEVTDEADKAELSKDERPLRDTSV